MRQAMILSVFLVAGVVPWRGHARDAVPAACLPPAIGDLRAIEIPQDTSEAMRRLRNTEIAGYNAEPFRTAVTVYRYDKAPVDELRKEFAASAADVLALHADAESPRSGPSRLRIAGSPTEGYLGIFLWSEGETDVGSFLWVSELSGRYLKIRATYVRPERDDQTGAAMRYAMEALQRVADHVRTPAAPTFGIRPSDDA
jgi:hypothetical protein